MTENQWNKRRRQNIRQTAIEIAKEIHKTNAKALNKKTGEEEDKEDRNGEEKEVKIIFPEEVINDASMIEKYIEKGQKVYKDKG